MATIEVDFEVFKELTQRRRSEATSYNDVIREALRLPPRVDLPEGDGPLAEPRGWLARGVLFPNGTEFRVTYKGLTHFAKVVDGRLVIGGKPVKTLSEASTTIQSGFSTGWRQWECRFPNESTWRRLESLRPPR